MSSHWKWAEGVIKEHWENLPYAPENGEPLKFQPGDRVIYTNLYGVEFTFTVTSLRSLENLEEDLYYALGQRYNLDWDSPWISVREDCLRFFPETRKERYDALV